MPRGAGGEERSEPVGRWGWRPGWLGGGEEGEVDGGLTDVAQGVLLRDVGQGVGERAVALRLVSAVRLVRAVRGTDSGDVVHA